MIRALLLAAAAPLAALVPATPASSAPLAASAVDKFAVCATKNYDGAELLATQPGSAEEAEVIAEYGRRSCAPPALDAGILRGAVAEQLFKADFGSIGARPRRETIEVFTVDPSELAALGDAAKKRIDYVAFGTCVAASNPDQSSKLLGTSPRKRGRESDPDRARAPIRLVPDGGRALHLLARRLAQLPGGRRLSPRSCAIAERGSRGDRHSRSVEEREVQAPGRTGSHMRKNVCLTEAQWTARDRDNEILAEDLDPRGAEIQRYQHRRSSPGRVSPAVHKQRFGTPPMALPLGGR